MEYADCAFSYDAKLLILDEPTSGLDPVVRDDILNMILDFVADHKRSVLLSSHITSDQEKIVRLNPATIDEIMLICVKGARP